MVTIAACQAQKAVDLIFGISHEQSSQGSAS